MPNNPSGAWWRVTIWFAFWLLCIDAGLNLLTHFEARRTGGQSSLARYFEYGRSLEGKLARVMGPDGQRPDPIISAGWLDPQAWRALPARVDRPEQKFVAVYGQSFVFRVADHAAKRSPSWVVRKVGAPAAPLSHAHAAYQLDTERQKADVVIVGILASALDKTSRMSGLGYTFESPAPYTFPVHVQDSQGQWHLQWPVIRSEAAFRQAFADRSPVWHQFEQDLMAHNPALDAFTVQQSVLDHSVLMRLARRGWVAGRNVGQLAPHSGQGAPSALASQWPVVLHLLQDLQAKVSARQERLIVVLFQDKGSDSSVGPTLKPLAQKLGLTLVDSADFIDPRDGRNFEPDGHFTPAGDERLAQEVLARMAQP